MVKVKILSAEDLKLRGMEEVKPGVYQKIKKVVPLVNYLLPELSEQKQELIFRWADKHVSLNDIYSSKHWTSRDKIVKEWHKFFKSYLTLPYPRFNKYKVELMYNSKLDVSNTIMHVKMVEDMLQIVGVIPNDTKEFCRGISLVPNEEMKKFSYKITVTNLI